MLESILPFLVIVLITVVGNWLEKKKKQAAPQQRPQSAPMEPAQRRQQMDEDEDEEDFDDEEELEPETPVFRREVPTEPDRSKSVPTPSQHHAPTPVAPNPLQELLKKMAEAQEAARRISQPTPPPPVVQVAPPVEVAKPRPVAKSQPFAEPAMANAYAKVDASPAAIRQAMLWKVALDEPRSKRAWAPR